MKHLIIDCETLGTPDNSVVLEFTAGLVDASKSTEPDVLFSDNLKIISYKLDVAPQAAVGRLVDKGTLEWWKSQPPELRKKVLVPNPAIDRNPEGALDGFADWLRENKFDKRRDYVWQRGSKDSDWLTSLMLDFGYKADNLPIMWWRVRELRTAVDVLGISSKLNGYPDEVDELRAMIPGYTQHDSRSDVMLEALILKRAGLI